jgi:hypothetical protein
LTVTNGFRKAAVKMAENPWFENTILFFIILNSILTAIDDPKLIVRPQWLQVFDYIFITVFSAEMIVKIVAMGFVMQQNTYLRDPWNAVSLKFLTAFSLILL